VDAIRQADIDEFSHLGQQWVTGVELVGVVTAERIQVVDDQEHLAEAIVGRRAVTLPFPECLSLLPGQQQLLQLTEGATDAFGFQRRRDAADVRQILTRP
jgi:hypothetical protein